MEISVKRTGPGGRVVQRTTTPQKKASAQRTVKQDKAAWSRQAIELIQRSQKETLERIRKKQEEKDPYISAFETKKKQLDALQKNLRVQNLCNKIAASIMRGDRVPPEDLQYIAQHDIDGYRLAIASRKPKRNPEEVKSVLTDEDKRAESDQQDNSEEAAACAESAAPAGDAAGAASVGGDMA